MSAILEDVSVDDDVNVTPFRGEFDYLIPAASPTYVRWGHYETVEKIVRSGKFFPTAITGMSGNGKTVMVEQVCASLKRHLIRINISKATTESHLIGGFRLENGDTEWEDGPVIRAMKIGAVLLIDEFDRGHPGEMVCLHSVLEGKSYYIKAINQLIQPAPGFTVIGTANTKGRGSTDGRYIAASVQDDALMERFPVWFDQGYPDKKAEAEILLYLFESLGYSIDKKNKEFYYLQTLLEWAQNLRKSFDTEGIDDFITTRRLCSVVMYYDIVGDLREAVKGCISKFDAETREAMLKEFQLRLKTDQAIQRLIDDESRPAIAKAVQASVDALSEIPIDYRTLQGFTPATNDDRGLDVKNLPNFG